MKKTNLLTLFALLISFNLFSQAGSLDESFGINGVTTTDNSYNDDIIDLAIQPDGKIVAVGLTVGGAAVLRYKTDGILDSSFGINGIVTLSPLGSNQAYSVALQADGKIVVGIRGSKGGYDYNDFVIARLLVNGTPDKSFGSDGIAITDVNHSDNLLRRILIQPDGRIVAVGASFTPFRNSFFYSIELVRYNTDGSLDQTFGIGGIESFQKKIGYSISSENIGAGLTSTGKIVVATSGGKTAGYDALVMRFNSNGSLDSAFGNDGLSVSGTDKDDISINNLKVLADDKILLCGSDYEDISNAGFLVIKLSADGHRDNSFGHTGWVRTPIPKSAESDAFGIDVQQDGKIILAGYAANLISQRRMVLVRCMPNGIMDTGFGANGIAYVDGKAYSNAIANTVAIQNDGKIVTGGVNFVRPYNSPDFMLTRFNGDNNFAVARLQEKNTINTNKHISLFPNPASNMLTVTGLNAHASTTIMITDNNGKVVTKAISVNQSAHTINLSHLKPGVYFLQLTENNITTTLKFLKQ